MRAMTVEPFGLQLPLYQNRGCHTKNKPRTIEKLLFLILSKSSVPVLSAPNVHYHRCEHMLWFKKNMDYYDNLAVIQETGVTGKNTVLALQKKRINHKDNI